MSLNACTIYAHMPNINKKEIQANRYLGSLLRDLNVYAGEGSIGRPGGSSVQKDNGKA